MELADTSAWTRRDGDPSVRESFDELVRTSEIAICDMVKLELLVTSQTAAELIELRAELDELPQCPIRPRAWRRALDVLEALADRGPLHHRRVALPDLLVAAAAEDAGIPLCHYDADFELIASITGQPVRAIAPLGTL